MSIHNIPLSIQNRKSAGEIIPNTIKSAAISFFVCFFFFFFCKGLKNKFETAVVNEPSVFEPLKFYCTSNCIVTEFQFLQVSKFIQGWL